MSIINAISEITVELIGQSQDLDTILISEVPSRFLEDISDLVNEASDEGRNFLYVSEYIAAVVQLEDCTHHDLLQVLTHTECLNLIKGIGSYSHTDIHLNLANSLKLYYSQHSTLSLQDINSINRYIDKNVKLNNTNYEITRRN